MTVPVWWLTNHEDVQSHGPWDSGLLRRLFEQELWPLPWDFEHRVNVSTIDEGAERGIVVLSARHHASDDDVAWLNEELHKLKACVLMLIGDEEGVFPWRRVMHDNCRFWVMAPHIEAHFDMVPWAFFFGTGWKYDTPDLLPTEQPTKDVPWSFAGQVTHERRREAMRGLGKCRTQGEAIGTEGFGQGLDRAAYLDLLARTKVAPCPAGPFTPDTFRTYEALEAGCYPIVDARSVNPELGYWEFTYPGGVPFDVVDDWGTVGGYIEAAVRDWPGSGAIASAWWVGEKRRMAERLTTDLMAAGCEKTWADSYDQLTTVVVTASPIPAHPDVSMLERTIESVWDSMGRTVPVVVAFDGVRTEQAAMRKAYEQAIYKVCWWAQHRTDWAGMVQPIISREHLHQRRLTKLALESVTTPTILFMEHDTPFNRDPIDWKKCLDLMAYGALDVLRFHHESEILDVHRYLMVDPWTTAMLGVPLRRTRQWSQRPHLAGADYYRSMLNGEWWKRPNNGFIEDTMHGIAQNVGGHRIGIYHPEGGIQRTEHLDGRAGGPKFEEYDA